MRAKYVMSEVFLGLWRNISMTIAMIITMAVTLTMLGAGLLLYNQVDVIEEYYQTNLEVVIYLERDISQEQIDQIESDLLSNDLVARVEFESQEEAWKRFQDTFEESPDLVASVNAEVLPPAFRIKMKNIDDADQLIAEYTEREGVSQASNQKEILQDVFDYLAFGQNATLFIAALLGVAAFALVANTIQVAAYSRRREVAIMKLVGAPNWFVQVPFVMEAVFAGLIGSLFAFGSIVAVKLFVLDRGSLAALANLLPPIEWSTVLLLLPILAAISAAISAVTAWVTLRFVIRV